VDDEPERQAASHHAEWSCTSCRAGAGRPFLNNGGFWSKILGGWQTGQTFEWQPGPLLQFGNIFYYGNPDDIALEDPTLNDGSTPTRVRTQRDASCRQTFRSGSSRCAVDGLRGDQTLLLNSSISRTFPLMGRSNLQIRLDAANMLNRQQFANPQLNPTATDFGRVTANANTEPRFLILMSKLTF
jgi:hypothetical protein